MKNESWMNYHLQLIIYNLKYYFASDRSVKLNLLFDLIVHTFSFYFDIHYASVIFA